MSRKVDECKPLIPGSEKFTIVRYGNSHVNGDAPPQKNMNVQTLLDYRCHAPGGAVGTQFPFKFRRCIQWLSAAAVPRIAARFGFEKEAEAGFVRARARSLQSKVRRCSLNSV